MPELDGIRGAAILLVVVWHYGYCQIQTQPGTAAAYLMQIFSLTWAGVDLFFVLTGFLLGGILIRNREAAGYFRTFYVRRACRILPLYYLSLALFAVASELLVSGPPSLHWAWLLGDPLPMGTYPLFVQNFWMADATTFGPNWLGATWSLAVEEQFYLILPLIIRFVPPGMLVPVVVAFIVSAPVVRIGMLWFDPSAGFAAYVLLPSRWDALFLGVLGAVAANQLGARGAIVQSLTPLRWLMLAVGLTLVGMIVGRQGINSYGMMVGGYTLLAALALATILLAIASRGGVMNATFRNPVLMWFGSISYGIYLLHQPVAGLLHGIVKQQSPRIGSLTDGLITLAALFVTLIMAILSSRFIEKPMVAIGHRLSYAR